MYISEGGSQQSGRVGVGGWGCILPKMDVYMAWQHFQEGFWEARNIFYILCTLNWIGPYVGKLYTNFINSHEFIYSHREVSNHNSLP